jgi:hypothetical protein
VYGDIRNRPGYLWAPLAVAKFIVSRTRLERVPDSSVNLRISLQIVGRTDLGLAARRGAQVIDLGHPRLLPDGGGLHPIYLAQTQK